MERVEMEVATGDFCHSKYDLLINRPDPIKPKHTTVSQTHLTTLLCNGYKFQLMLLTDTSFLPWQFECRRGHVWLSSPKTLSPPPCCSPHTGLLAACYFYNMMMFTALLKDKHARQRKTYQLKKQPSNVV